MNTTSEPDTQLDFVHRVPPQLHIPQLTDDDSAVLTPGENLRMWAVIGTSFVGLCCAVGWIATA